MIHMKLYVVHYSSILMSEKNVHILKILSFFFTEEEEAEQPVEPTKGKQPSVSPSLGKSSMYMNCSLCVIIVGWREALSSLT